MFRLDEAIVSSASDLTLASRCEFAFLRQLDLKLGRIEGVPVVDDPMLRRAGALGDEHERRVAAEYRRHNPGETGVVEIAWPSPMNRESLRAAAEQTRAAFASGAAVVYQATFFDETDASAPFLGFADFIVRQPDGRYRVQDTKLARSPKVSALLQLAAYHQQLRRIGVPTDDTVELILGDGRSSMHHIDEIAPVFANRRARLLTMIDEHLAEPGAVQWGDERYAVDGRCEHCEPEVQASRDLLLVAGMRVSQRAKLMSAGIRTLDQLAAAPTPPVGTGIAERTYATLHAQAALQATVPPTVDPHAAPPFELFRPGAIAELPPPDPGDIFFDFEGDPLFRVPGDTSAREALWGLDYLFGLVDVDEVFTSFWAHDLAEEKRALIDFLGFVALRRAAHPGMHIYHYAPYERTHLLSIAARHGVGEDQVDSLLRDGVLVDLYPLVKKSLRIGGRSYSIKKLEPLYMGAEHRADDGVTNALASVEEYVRSREALLADDPGESQRLLDGIADYNRYDCVSTLRLRDWLIDRAAESGVHPSGGEILAEGDVRAPFEPSPLNLELSRLAGEAGERGDDAARGAYELGAAAIDYHRREAKSFWWEHFARLVDPVDDWSETRGVMLVEQAEVVDDWGMTGRMRRMRRTLRLRGTWGPGSGAPKGDAFLLYDDPSPYRKAGRRSGTRLDIQVRMVPDPDDESCVIVSESCPEDETPWHDIPLAVAPGPPPRADSLVAAIEGWAGGLVETAGAPNAPSWPRDAASDILQRLPPRTTAPLERMTDAEDGVRAVVASVLRLDDSYLAVQGPPGTGKTYLASRVVAELVRDHGWRVGVVAQSHKVVENVLDQIVAAGLPGRLVGKSAPSEFVNTGYYATAGFLELPKDGQARFAQENAGSGYVLGGTAWDLTNLKRVARRQLDLLVIDEAGQFSLAATVAVGQSARNLLLLGDPQQLPQVSQGTHPAPVDQSALGYISSGHDVLPPELGYFLPESRRMDALVTEPVSRLSYDGALRAHASTRARLLEGISPGLHPVAVDHRGNATSSVEEARRIVELVRRHLGRAWTDPGNGPGGRLADPLNQRDVIVVTPYNAQVELLRVTLDAAGYEQVRVGTVDRFQGQEAVIAIVSLAASSPDEVPRGLSFLLSRNRLNVAVSRAQWAAYLVSSPALREHLPQTPEGVAELSRFLGLVGPSAQPTR